MGELTQSALKLAQSIDHTLLNPEATIREIEKLCQEAREYQFASVCLHPHYVSLARQLLHSSSTKVCTVVGFPLGMNTTNVKAFEARECLSQGAEEIDMVVNMGAIKNEDWVYVESDIKEVVKASTKATVKVIIETCRLQKDEKVRTCLAAKQAGAHFVKTSTGFGTSGAMVEDVQLMHQTVGPSMGVKASGGIRNRQQALAMIAAGATRLGTSSGVQIIKEQLTFEGE